MGGGGISIWERRSMAHPVALHQPPGSFGSWWHSHSPKVQEGHKGFHKWTLASLSAFLYTRYPCYPHPVTALCASGFPLILYNWARGNPFQRQPWEPHVSLSQRKLYHSLFCLFVGQWAPWWQEHTSTACGTQKVWQRPSKRLWLRDVTQQHRKA